MNQVAILAAGCFWGVQHYFDQVPGVIETTVGYIGGHVDKPTYEQVCAHVTGHAEAVKIIYNPHQVLEGSKTGAKNAKDELSEAFNIILCHFFRIHDPTQLNRQGPDVGDNYRSAIFYHDEKQKMEAKKMIDKLNGSGEYKRRIVTTLEPASTFWRAENYHQKFSERTGRGTCPVNYEPV